MELLVTGLQITLIGMGIVFLVLFILSLILGLFKSLFYKEENITKPSRSVRPRKKVIEAENGEDEVIAVISAIMSDLLEGDEYIANIKQV